MAALQVITSIQQKDSTNSYSSPIMIGAEQRFVKALRQSHNNNLEEQSILGVDCITVEEWDANNTHIITKEYHDGSKTADYYILKVEIYNDNAEIYIQDDALILSAYDEFNEVIGEDFKVIQKETLSYKDNNGNVKIISIKEVKRKIVNGVITTTEVITNNL